MVPEYREIRELGVGGGGRVVLATYAPTGAYVAIKYFGAALKDDARFLARFRAEARVLVELRDPNVVRLHEYYEDVLEAAVVMELVDGVALRRILDEHGTTSPEAALAVLKGSLLGLAAAHDAGILHRDHRPENVLVQADGGSKLADLGIVTPGGDPAYLAPERRRGAPASVAADVHAATCVFFECLTGHRPGENAPGAPPHGSTAPAPVEEVPSSVRVLVTRGMAADPADRPRDAREFLRELETAATAAYGPEWEQRGRRHLAEPATLLALTFPLARTAAETGASGRRGVFGRAGRPAGAGRAGRAGSAGRVGRGDAAWRPRLGPRTLAGLGVITVAMTAGVIAGNRPQDRLSADTIFTPPPGSAVIEETPARRRNRATAPAGPTEPSTRLSPSLAAERGSPPSRGGTPRHVPPLPSAIPARPRTTAPTPTGPQPRPPEPTDSRTPPGRPPAPTPRGTPSPTGSPTGSQGSPEPEHTVGDLTIAAIGAHGVTIRLRASTPGNVTATVVLAEGPDPDGLVQAPPRTAVLAGSTSYAHTVPYAFAVPDCGETLYRRVTVSTVPASPGGAFSRTEEVRGEPCALPPGPDADDAPDPGPGPGRGPGAEVGVHLGADPGVDLGVDLGVDPGADPGRPEEPEPPADEPRAGETGENGMS